MNCDRDRCAIDGDRRTVDTAAGCDVDPPRPGLAGLTVKGPAIHFAEHGAIGFVTVGTLYEGLDGLTLMSGVGVLEPGRVRRPTLERGQHRRRAIAVLALVVALVGGACRSSNDDEIVDPTSTESTSSSSVSSVTSTSTSSTSSTTSIDGSNVTAEAQARYLAFWDARFEANTAPPDPEDPALAEYATGAQLDNVIAETQRRLDAGHALRAADPSQTSHEVTVVSAEEGRVELQDCFVNDGVVYEIESGAVVDDSVVTRSVSALMVRVAGVWKLERASVVQEWEGVAGCALAS